MAPAPEGAVGFGCARVNSTSVDVVPSSSWDLGGDEPVGCCTVAELAVIVKPPAPEGAVGFGCARLGQPEGDMCPFF